MPYKRIDAASKTRIRALGHVILCGALHICWQSKEIVTGQYMICLLYQDCLCLATASRADQIYTVQACIGRHSMRVEDLGNSRGKFDPQANFAANWICHSFNTGSNSYVGLQCHAAPFSWKLLFECDCQLYEILMTACSSKEESEWRWRLDERTNLPAPHFSYDPFFCSSLNLDIRPLGAVFGKPGKILSLSRKHVVIQALTSL